MTDDCRLVKNYDRMWKRLDRFFHILEICFFTRGSYEDFDSRRPAGFERDNYA